MPGSRAPYLVAAGACVIAVAGCGGSHKVDEVNPATTPLNAEKAKKIAAIQKTRKAVAAVAPTHVVGRHSGCEDATFATWSPDGRRIAWPGRTSICVADADGSNAHSLLHTRGTVDSPTQLMWIKPGLMLYGDNYTISRILIGAKPQIFKGIQAPAFAVATDGSRFATSTKSDCPLHGGGPRLDAHGG